MQTWSVVSRVLGVCLLVLVGCRPAQPNVAASLASPTVPPGAVVVTHWAVAELMAPELLPKFAAAFNTSGQHTASGKPIVVRPVLVSSAKQVELLEARVGRGAAVEPSIPDPVVVTPKIDHWLSQVNTDLGRTVVDLSTTRDLAISWLGIATYREMAECLGWPTRDIGIADIMALRADPRGWASCPTAKAEWGAQPLLTFTDPSTSSTARSTLFALYAQAAGKPTDQLTETDVSDPVVVERMRQMQRQIDHYVADTLILQSKMYHGPRYGHFYFVEENTLVQLYQGKLPVTVGAETKPEPLSRDMVFIYPKEGSLAHNHPAGLVQAPWVSPEQTEAAARWVSYLREDAQQQGLMAGGFRPATRIPYADPISARFGLDPAKPTAVLPPVNPAAVKRMVQSWEEVKKPGIVTFVVDVSGSMQGAKIEQAKRGLVQALDNLSQNNQVGLIAFADGTRVQVPVAPIAANRFVLADQARALQVGGNTHLYDAIREAVRMTDAASGDPDATRGVVVLTDGESNGGSYGLLDVVRATTRAEEPLSQMLGPRVAQGSTGPVQLGDVIGAGLSPKLALQHSTHIFYVGIGKEADMEVGRILAEATGAAYQGATEKDLNAVIEKFGKYF